MNTYNNILTKKIFDINSMKTLNRILNDCVVATNA